MEIDVHDDVMRGLHVADSEIPHRVHRVVTVFGARRTDQIEQDGEAGGKVMIANERQAAVFEVQSPHNHQNNVSIA